MAAVSPPSHMQLLSLRLVGLKESVKFSGLQLLTGLQPVLDHIIH